MSIIQRIKRLFNGGWIDVKDELPPTYKIVWGKIYNTFGYAILLDSGKWISGCQNCGEDYIYIQVKYWKYEL